MNAETAAIYYRVLGLAPGASRQEVKHAYRELAKTWHPDRFAQDARLQQAALEKIKDINHAYAKLHPARAIPAAQSGYPAFSPRQPRRTLSTWLVVLVAFGTLRLCLPHLLPAPPSPSMHVAAHARSRSGAGIRLTPKVRSLSAASRDGPVPSEIGVAATPEAADPPAIRPRPAFFTVGSTREEVRAIQGTPKLADAHVWEYGGARVYFRHGRVTRWEMWSGDPLKVRLTPALPVETGRHFFTVGSTKDEVLAIQGTPTRFSARVWEYDYSRVYFEADQVERWEAWPGSPLKAKLLPSTSVPAADYFTVGSTKDEVLRVQGAPTRFSARVWEYGQSRVYFRDNRVIRWQEWRRSPLKARLVPSAP